MGNCVKQQSIPSVRQFSPVVPIGNPLLPHLQASVSPPAFDSGEGTHSLAGQGVGWGGGGAQFGRGDSHCGTLGTLYI